MFRRMVLLATMYVPLPLPAQIYFGQVEVRIGETRSSVMARLRTQFTLDSLPRDPPVDLWDIVPRGSFRSLGNVEFDKDTVVLVSKDWLRGRRDVTGDVAVVQAIVDAMISVRSARKADAFAEVDDRLSDLAKNMCTFYNVTRDNPKYDVAASGFLFACTPTHSVHVGVSRSRDGKGAKPSAFVLEEIASVKRPKAP